MKKMSEWKEKNLSKVAFVNPTESISKGEEAKKVAMEELQPFTKKISGYSIEEYKGGSKFRNGDTLVARITPSLENGKTAFVDILDDGEVGFGSTEFIVLREKEGISDKEFLYYLAMSPEFREIAILSMTGSSGRQRVQTDVVEKHEFLIPSFTEQKAIASVLSSLDDKIDLLHRQNQTLEAMAETLFRQWFQPSQKLRSAGVEEAAEEDWEEVKVGDFVETNRSNINKDYDYELIEYLNTGSLTEGKITEIQQLSLSEAPSRAKRLVKHNDIVISTVRPNQKHYGIIKNPNENMVVSTGFCVISCHNIDPHFIYFLLTNDEMTEYLHSIAEGSTSTYPSLKPSDIERIEFQMPPKESLKRFSEIASEYWDKIEFNSQQIQILEKLRDTLLPKLMSGYVRINFKKISHGKREGNIA